VHEGEGSSGDSIVIYQKINSVESPLLPSPLSSHKSMSSRILSLKKISYLTEIRQAEE
jgi:hypothetical protein